MSTKRIGQTAKGDRIEIELLQGSFEHLIALGERLAMPPSISFSALSSEPGTVGWTW